jgi:hypothetical protein
MTLDQFAAITAERIPTPPEFVAFATEQGWTFSVDGERASLRVPDGADPMARAFAKMLSREPYRTNVLDALNATTPAEPDEHPPIVCGTCRAEFHAPEAEVRAFMQSPAFCDKPKCRFR